MPFFPFSPVKTRLAAFGVLGAAVLALGACDLAKNQITLDRSGDLQREDYRRALAPRPEPEEAAGAIPDLQSYVAPPEEETKAWPLVTVSVNQTVPLRDLLFEIAEQAEVDIEIDPNIKGAIVFTVRERPFDEVIDRIADMTGLRYKFKNGVLRMEIDRPYLKTYKLSHAIFSRKLENDIETEVAISGGDAAESDSGSKSKIETELETDFWKDLETSLESILESSDKNRGKFLITAADPEAAPRAPENAAGGARGGPVPPPPSPAGVRNTSPAPAAASPTAGLQPGGLVNPAASAAAANAIAPNAGEETSASGTAAGTQTTGAQAAAAQAAPAQPAPTSAAATPAGQGQAQQPAQQGTAGTGPTGQDLARAVAPELRVTPPTEEAAKDSKEEELPESTFTINRQAGIISIFANARQHADVQDYLEKIYKALSAQVLVEAKVLEVALTDEFAAGIDWNSINNLKTGAAPGPGQNLINNNTGLGSLDLGVGFGIPTFSNPITPGDQFVATYLSDDISVALQAISRFGTTRALASPRVTVMNNQPAILNVSENRVYFELEFTPGSVSDGTVVQPTISSTPQSVSIGLTINVTPSIDLDTGEITMLVRPTVTRQIGTVEDPGVPLAIATGTLGDAALQTLLNTVSSPFPEVSVKEIDSVVRMQSGQAIVMGGLMEDKNVVTETGVPVVADLPLVGNFFKSHKDEVQKTELVIFLKATIIPGSNIHKTDKDLYNTFSLDRRPFKL